MKKKSFFNGYNAKLALAVVALTGSLLTGCYKDEGLDIIDPDQSVTLPAAKYTITGTIYSSEGAVLKNATVTSDKGTVAQKEGSFTISELSDGEVKVTAKCAGFDDQTTTVSIAKLNAGQAAVYPLNFVMGKTATTKEVELRYNLKVTVLDEDMQIIDDADVTVYGAGATVVNYESEALKAGAYKIKASKEGFVSTIQYLTLPNAKVEVPADFAEAFKAEEYATEIVLVKTATGTVVIAGDLKFGDRWMLAKVVRLYNDKGTQFYGEGNSNTYAYKFNVPETEFVEAATTKASAAEKFFAANFKIVDENGVQMTMVQNIAKPTAEPGQEQPNVEVKVDFKFAAEVSRVNEDSTLAATKEVFEPMITNATDRKRQYFYNIPVKKGTIFKSESAGGLTDQTALGYAILNAMEEATSKIKVDADFANDVIEKGYSFELAPYTALKSVTSKQEFVKFALTVTKVTSTTTITVGEDVTTTTTDVEVEGLDKVKTVYEEAGKTTVDYADLEIESISHDHGHSHGHGSGNAGGGIIEAE